MVEVVAAAMDTVAGMDMATGMASAVRMPGAITVALPARAAISVGIVSRPDGRVLVRCAMPGSAPAIRATP